MRSLKKRRSVSPSGAFGRPAFGLAGSRWLQFLLALTAVLPARAASPWRFWTKADGLSESVSFGLTADAAGRIVVKGGDVPVNVLDGYQITQIPSPRAYGRMLASSNQELWTFDAKGINIHDASGWHTYPDTDIAEFAGTSPMARMSWFTYSVFRGPEDRMDVVPFGKDSGVIMFPDRLLEWNRVTGRKRLLKVAGQTGLARFRDIQNSRDGGLWLTGETGLARLRDAGGDYEWHEFPAPAQRSDLVSPIEGEDGEVFVSAMRPGGQTGSASFLQGRLAGHLLRGQRRIEGLAESRRKNLGSKGPEDHPARRGRQSRRFGRRQSNCRVDHRRGNPARPHFLARNHRRRGSLFAAPVAHPRRNRVGRWSRERDYRGQSGPRLVPERAVLIVNDHGTWNQFRLPSGATEKRCSPTMSLRWKAAIWLFVEIHWRI